MKTLKKTLCILISVLMLTAFMPVVSFAGENQVTVDDNVVLNSDKPYFVNGTASATGTLGEDGCTAYYDADSKTLTLNGYGGSLGYGTGSGAVLSDSDLIIVAEGENYINTKKNEGIGVRGDLRIEGDENSHLTVFSGEMGICADGAIGIIGVGDLLIHSDKTCIQSGVGKSIDIIDCGWTGVNLRSDSTFNTPTINSNGGSLNINVEKLYVSSPNPARVISTESQNVPASIVAEKEIDIQSGENGVAVYPNSSYVELTSGHNAGVVTLNNQSTIYAGRKLVNITVDMDKNEDGSYSMEYTGNAPVINAVLTDAETGEVLDIEYEVAWLDKDKNYLSNPPVEIGNYLALVFTGTDEYMGYVELEFNIVAPKENPQPEVKPENNDKKSPQTGAASTAVVFTAVCALGLGLGVLGFSRKRKEIQ